MPVRKRKRIGPEDGPENQVNMSGYPPEEYKDYFACPFPKHDPDRYLTVNNVCTERWGFKDIGELNYHILRVHAPSFGCVDCKSRFTRSKKGLSQKEAAEQAQRNHDCKPRDFIDKDPEWMTKNQESRLATWKEGKGREGGAESWIKIYRCLFEAAEQDVPSPFYDFLIPAHLVAPSSRNESQAPPFYLDNIDRSLTQQIASEDQGQGMGKLEALEDQQRPQLNPDSLEKQKGRDKHGFDWVVKPAIDSGYGSGNAQEIQELDIFFSQEASTSLAEQVFPIKDKWTEVIHTQGHSDLVNGADFEGLLNLSDEEDEEEEEEESMNNQHD